MFISKSVKKDIRMIFEIWKRRLEVGSEEKRIRKENLDIINEILK